MSTLSVETSSSGSSASTWSPTCLSQRLTVPSVTLSPRAGRVTSVPLPDPPPELGAGPESSAFGSSGCDAGSGSGSEVSWLGSSAGASSAPSSPPPAYSPPASSPPESPPPESPPASLASPITASTAPTSTVSSSCALISSSTPDVGEGISVSTLSVETSRRGSSASTVSPTCLSQRLTVPSVTLSPSAGRVTEVDMTGWDSFVPWMLGSGPSVPGWPQPSRYGLSAKPWRLAIAAKSAPVPLVR